ncbi:hypothetical protein ACFO5R_12810 [Halosolutus amylolyticus]|uniref:Uncharacterized protein n=1 Tax=Halosolutus amylolyticus TaxID=2932267 RepID=A0ABD5PQQ4_9EURY|nr:hypothetical protein [Halosolutus amylolyticus]
MDYRFSEWLRCPSCDEVEDISMMAHKTDIVLECYECGQISEYTVGEDIAIHELDIDAIAEVVDEQFGD